MQLLIKQITELLQQANTLAETLDNFKMSEASVTIQCTNGKSLRINDSLHDHGDETLGENTSSHVISPPTDVIDDLGSIKTNVWF